MSELTEVFFQKVFRCTIPEGVEVKLSAELIRPIVKDRLVVWMGTHPTSRYATEDPEGYKEFQNTLSKLDCPVYIKNVNTKGKFMYWSFTNDWYLMCTFGMTGQWSSTKGKHPCFHIRHGLSQIEDNQYMYFNDPRHFGTIKFVESKKALNEKLSELGWDPLQDDLYKYQGWLNSQLNKTSKPIGQVLMDQSIFAGVGNYIRAEALYLVKMSPWRPANQLSKDDFQLLCQGCIDVMQESYKHQGATIQTYKTAYGEESRYSSLFKVYGKKADPLGNKIIKENTPEGRTIYWCPSVQK